MNYLNSDVLLYIYLNGIWIIFLCIYLWNVYDEFTTYKKTLNAKTFKLRTSFKYFRTEVLEWTGFWITVFWPITIPLGTVGLVISHQSDASIAAYLLIKWDKYKNPEKYI